MDPEEILPWAKEHDLPEDMAELATNETVTGMVQEELDRANSNYAQVEQIKKFVILDRDLTIEDGELTPTLKVKRNVVNEHFGELFDSLYG
jgi:long-chain acyl-CoA synthetase